MKTIVGVVPVEQETDYSCGIGALETIFQFYGAPIGGNLGLITDAGMNHDAIRRVAAKKGFTTEEFVGTLDDSFQFIDDGLPVLVNYQDYGANDGENGHYAVAIGYTDRTIVLADPGDGGRIKDMELGEFKERWNDRYEPGIAEDRCWGAVVFPKSRLKEFEDMKFKNYVKRRMG